MTNDGSAEQQYSNLSGKMTPTYFGQIQQFYESWQGQQLIDLNFRFIKILARHLKETEPRWYFFHQLVNKRRISNEMLPELLRSIIDEGIYPLRIFASCTEWLAPNEVWRKETPRIIRSGFVPFENDDNLHASINTACELVSVVKDPVLIYTGNKSIHVWVPISISQLSDKELAFADQRELAELNYRYQFFEQIKSQISYNLDKRVSTDTRRVVPIPGSLNAFTGRKVINIKPSKVCELNDQMIKENASIAGWRHL